MIANHPTSHSRRQAFDDLDQPAHVDSELCWCEPIVDVDEDGNRALTHKEVIWN
jgi:hypothetical protein